MAKRAVIRLSSIKSQLEDKTAVLICRLRKTKGDTNHDSWAFTLVTLLTYLCVQQALILSSGSLHFESLSIVLVGFIGLAVAWAFRPKDPKPPSNQILFLVSLCILWMQLGYLSSNPTSNHLAFESTRLVRLTLIPVAAVAMLPFIGRHLSYAFPLWIVVSAYCLAGCWVLRLSTSPPIDLWPLHREALDALLGGRNPFAITFENIYGNDRFYGPGLTHGDRVLFGYVYPPLGLLLSIPGHILFQDYRYSLLLANATSALLVGASARNAYGVIAAALFLFGPQSLYTLEMGWTEPWAMLAVAATVYCEIHHKKAVPWMLGLVISAKQNCIIFAPLAVLLPSVRASLGAFVRSASISAVVALCINLPFLLWNPSRFFWSTVESHKLLYFREDALNIAAWMVYTGYKAPARLWTWIAIAIATGWVLLRAQLTVSAFLAGSAFVSLASMMFYRAAFCNYYWLVGGLLIASVVCSTAISADQPIAFRAALSQEFDFLRHIPGKWFHTNPRRFAQWIRKGKHLISSLLTYYALLVCVGIAGYVFNDSANPSWSALLTDEGSVDAFRRNNGPRNVASMLLGGRVRVSDWARQAGHHPSYLIDEEREPTAVEKWSSFPGKNAWVEISFSKLETLNTVVLYHQAWREPNQPFIPRYRLWCIRDNIVVNERFVIGNSAPIDRQPFYCHKVNRLRIDVRAFDKQHPISLYEVEAWAQP